jgi:hypothetical protein
LSQRQKGWHLSVLRSWVFNELMTWGPVKPVKQTHPTAPCGGAVLIRCQAQP